MLVLECPKDKVMRLRVLRLIKYGPVLKRKWAVEEWLRNIYAECFWKEIAVKRKKCCMTISD